MTQKVKEAIEALRELPAREQETFADAIIGYASRDTRLQLSDEQVAEVKRRMAKKNRKFISLSEARTRLRRFVA